MFVPLVTESISAMLSPSFLPATVMAVDGLSVAGFPLVLSMAGPVILTGTINFYLALKLWTNLGIACWSLAGFLSLKAHNLREAKIEDSAL